MLFVANIYQMRREHARTMTSEAWRISSGCWVRIRIPIARINKQDTVVRISAVVVLVVCTIEAEKPLAAPSSRIANEGSAFITCELIVIGECNENSCHEFGDGATVAICCRSNAGESASTCREAGSGTAAGFLNTMVEELKLSVPCVSRVNTFAAREPEGKFFAGSETFVDPESGIVVIDRSWLLMRRIAELFLSPSIRKTTSSSELLGS